MIYIILPKKKKFERLRVELFNSWAMNVSNWPQIFHWLESGVRRVKTLWLEKHSKTYAIRLLLFYLKMSYKIKMLQKYPQKGDNTYPCIENFHFGRHNMGIVLQEKFSWIQKIYNLRLLVGDCKKNSDSNQSCRKIVFFLLNFLLV